MPTERTEKTMDFQEKSVYKEKLELTGGKLELDTIPTKITPMIFDLTTPVTSG